ncbi:MAG: tRNA (adenosine(37)-N6)-threonylcarbamoyltransferase complex ATPase subunit type 1 TsaE [bacterium]
MIATDAAQTRAVGERLAACARAGAVLWLRGDLGAGKTELTKGMAAGLRCADPVSSPSFALIHEYTGGRLPLYHIDLYRLEGSAAEELGVEDYLEGDGVTVIEWGERLPPDYFPDGIEILLEYRGESDERSLTITPRGKCGAEWMEVAWGGEYPSADAA